mgnify:CR=1 FL=1
MSCLRNSSKQALNCDFFDVILETETYYRGLKYVAYPSRSFDESNQGYSNQDRPTASSFSYSDRVGAEIHLRSEGQAHQVVSLRLQASLERPGKLRASQSQVFYFLQSIPSDRVGLQMLSRSALQLCDGFPSTTPSRQTGRA